MTTHYGMLSLSHDGWKLEQVKPHVSLRLKKNFARINPHSSPPFYLQDTLDVAADLHWFMLRYPLLMNQQDKTYLESRHSEYLDTQAHCEAILAPNYIPKERLGFNEGYSLRNYQGIAVDFAEFNMSVLILDEIGLGKTIEGLAIATINLAMPVLYVVQPHLHDQWNDKAIEFMDATVHKIVGNKPYDLPPADIYIAKYNQLSPWVDVFSQDWLKGIVFDEVQELRRGNDSAKGVAATHICATKTYKVGLTASLVYNYGIESFNIANIIRPGILGTRVEFLREWCTETNDKGIVKDPDALGAYLIEQNMVIRRTKADVGQEAKQLAPHIEWVDHNAKAVKDLEELTKQLAMKALNSNFREAGQASREFDLRMRQMTGVAKAKSVAGYVRMFAQAGEPVLLYGWHREVYDIWMRELAELNPIMYTGSESPTQKEKAKQSFINGESKVLIMSLASGAGIDGLQHVCSTVIFGEFAWSSEIHRQCVGRVDRDGQTKEVFVFYVATNFGSDPEIIDVLGLKADQSKGIMDPYSRDKQTIKQTDANRIKRLASRYLEKNGLKATKIALEHKENETEKSMDLLMQHLNRGVYSVSEELVTQNQIEQVLQAADIQYEREKIFETGTVDFFLPKEGIAIEVKANKQWNKLEVFRQCERYCKEESVKGIVLATAKIQGLPDKIEGKPAAVLQLSLGALA